MSFSFQFFLLRTSFYRPFFYTVRNITKLGLGRWCVRLSYIQVVGALYPQKPRFARFLRGPVRAAETSARTPKLNWANIQRNAKHRTDAKFAADPLANLRFPSCGILCGYSLYTFLPILLVLGGHLRQCLFTRLA